MAVINGTKGGYLQPLRYGRDSSGRYAIYRWEGTTAEVNANIGYVEGLGGVWETEESFTGAHTILNARIPADPNGQDDTVNTWEFFAQTAEKDLLESDNAEVNALSEQNLAAIRGFLQTPPTPDEVFAGLDFGTDGDATTAEEVYNLMVFGVKSIRVNVPTLRHTATASGANTIIAVLENIGRIFSTSGLFRYEGIPNSVLFALPQDSSSKAGFAYGWYKKHPTVRAAARQKVQVEREWEYGLWPTLIYGSVLT